MSFSCSLQIFSSMIELSLLYALAMTFSLVLLSTPNDKSTFKDGHHTIVSKCDIDTMYM